MKKRKVKKGIYIIGIIALLILLLVLAFFMLGSSFLSIKSSDTGKVIEVNYKDENFKYGEVKCSFMGNDISKNVKMENEIDLSKIGEQEIKYTCKKYTFKKEIIVKYKVVDNVPPEIKLNGDVSLSIYVGDKYEDKGATAIDNVDGDITDKIVVDGNVDTTKEGEYELVYKITDSSNLTSTVKRAITVKKKPVQATTTSSSSS